MVMATSETTRAYRTALRFIPLVFMAAAAAFASGCGQVGGPPGGMPAGGQMPPMPVQILPLAESPVERVSNFVAVIKSRQSTTIQSQAEGFITRIAVVSGRRVSPGDVLFEIDAASQRAAVASLESLRAARQADAALARQQVDRARTLHEVGAMSLQEYEQAQAAQKAADAQLQAVEEQIRQQQAELDYYRVVAPAAGVVGDVPVRVGDRVTRSTVLTTVEDNAGLEVYVNVPVQDAPGLRVGLPVRLLDTRGKILTETRVSFVAPSVDDTTQTVLVKAPVAQRDGAFRADQYVNAQIVWGTESGLTVPVMAVSRINGMYFVFVAEEADGGLVARQRPITVGPVVGDGYLVTGGLSAGDRLVVAGIQKIGDGAPVQPLPSGPPAEGGRGAEPGRGGGA
jgi:RND family efflux transporter MFP subunit